MIPAVAEYWEGYKAYSTGAARYSWKSERWRHGWNDAATHYQAERAIAREKRGSK